MEACFRHWKKKKKKNFLSNNSDFITGLPIGQLQDMTSQLREKKNLNSVFNSVAETGFHNFPTVLNWIKTSLV